MGDGYEFDEQIRKELNTPSTLLTIQFPSLETDLILAGVDEAGRGPLAGPVVSAAVVLPSSPQILGLNDSKLLNEAQRETLFEKIHQVALSVAVSIVDHTIIDSINILKATLKAMREAVSALKIKPHLVLIDGNQKPASQFSEKTIVKGDQKSACIMAASIVAKVTRDRLMKQAHLQFPLYGFADHKGYGSPRHLEALRVHGPCEIHRKTFEPIKSILARERVVSI